MLVEETKLFTVADWQYSGKVFSLNGTHNYYVYVTGENPPVRLEGKGPIYWFNSPEKRGELHWAEVVTFESVLDSVSYEVQAQLLFHLNLFS